MKADARAAASLENLRRGDLLTVHCARYPAAPGTFVGRERNGKLIVALQIRPFIRTHLHLEPHEVERRRPV